MRCYQCGNDNEIKAKFCMECGAEMHREHKKEKPPVSARLYGKEVELLFWSEDPEFAQVEVIVNPTLDEVNRHRIDGIIQKVMIGTTGDAGESAAMILPFIKQSMDYLGEDFDPTLYRGLPPSELKKEYLRLFERVLKEKNKRQAKLDRITQQQKDIKP
jgi:hypothetical protein